MVVKLILILIADGSTGYYPLTTTVLIFCLDKLILDNDQPAPTSKSSEATTTQPEQPVMASGPADAGGQVEPVTKPDDQPDTLGITEPLPEPAMSIMIVSNTVDDGEEEEEELVRTVCCSIVCEYIKGCHYCYKSVVYRCV